MKLKFFESQGWLIEEEEVTLQLSASSDENGEFFVLHGSVNCYCAWRKKNYDRTKIVGSLLRCGKSDQQLRLR